MIKRERLKAISVSEAAPLRSDLPPDSELTVANVREVPASVTDRTTNRLDRDQPMRKGVAG